MHSGSDGVHGGSIAGVMEYMAGALRCIAGVMGSIAVHSGSDGVHGESIAVYTLI